MVECWWGTAENRCFLGLGETERTRGKWIPTHPNNTEPGFPGKSACWVLTMRLLLVILVGLVEGEYLSYYNAELYWDLVWVSSLQHYYWVPLTYSVNVCLLPHWAPLGLGVRDISITLLLSSISWVFSVSALFLHHWPRIRVSAFAITYWWTRARLNAYIVTSLSLTKHILSFQWWWNMFTFNYLITILGVP